MNKKKKILLAVVAIVGLFLIIAGSLKSCNDNKKSEGETTTSIEESTSLFSVEEQEAFKQLVAVYNGTVCSESNCCLNGDKIDLSKYTEAQWWDLIAYFEQFAIERKLVASVNTDIAFIERCQAMIGVFNGDLHHKEMPTKSGGSNGGGSSYTKVTVPPTQAPTQKPTEAPTQKPTEAPTQKPTVPSTQKPTEPTTQKPTEPTTQKPTEPTTEKPTEPEKEYAYALYYESNGRLLKVTKFDLKEGLEHYTPKSSGKTFVAWQNSGETTYLGIKSYKYVAVWKENSTQPTTEKPTQPTTEKPTQKPTEPTTQKPTQPVTEPTTKKQEPVLDYYLVFQTSSGTVWATQPVFKGQSDQVAQPGGPSVSGKQFIAWRAVKTGTYTGYYGTGTAYFYTPVYK